MGGKIEVIDELEFNNRKYFRELAKWCILNVCEESDPYCRASTNQLKNLKRQKSENGYATTLLRPTIQLYKSSKKEIKDKQSAQTSIAKKVTRAPKRELNKVFCHHATPNEAIQTYTELNAYTSCRKKKVDLRQLDQAISVARSRIDRPHTRGKVQTTPCSAKYIDLNYSSLKMTGENKPEVIKDNFIEAPKSSILKEMLINKSTKNFSKFTMLHVNQMQNTGEQKKRYQENNQPTEKEVKEQPEKDQRKEETFVNPSSNKPISTRFIETSALGTIQSNRRESIMSKKVFPKRKPLPIKILEVGKQLPMIECNLKDSNSKMKKFSQLFMKSKESNKKERPRSLNSMFLDHRSNNSKKIISSNESVLMKRGIAHLTLEDKLLNINSYHRNGSLYPISKIITDKENSIRSSYSSVAPPRTGPKAEKKNSLPAIKGIPKLKSVSPIKDNTLSALNEFSLRLSRRFKNTTNSTFNIREFLQRTRTKMMDINRK